MPELIKAGGNSDDVWFAISAIFQNGGHGKDIPRRDDGCLEIVLTVNGIEVPYAATVAEMFRRINERVNDRAAKIAYDNATLKPLTDLAETIQRVDWEIREAIERAFNVTLLEE